MTYTYRSCKNIFFKFGCFKWNIKCYYITYIIKKKVSTQIGIVGIVAKGTAYQNKN